MVIILLVIKIVLQSIDDRQQGCSLHAVILKFQSLLGIGDSKLVLALAEMIIGSVDVGIVVIGAELNRAVIMLQSAFKIADASQQTSQITVGLSVVRVKL